MKLTFITAASLLSAAIAFKPTKWPEYIPKVEDEEYPWGKVDTKEECTPGADAECKVPTDSCCKTYSTAEPDWVEYS